MNFQKLLVEKVTEVLRVHISSLPKIDDAQVLVTKKRSFVAQVSEGQVAFRGEDNQFSVRLRLMKGKQFVSSFQANLELSQLNQFVKSCYEKFSVPKELKEYSGRQVKHDFEYIDLKKPLNHYDEALFLVDYEEKVARLKNLLHKVYKKIGSTHKFQVSSSYSEFIEHESLWSLHMPVLLNDRKTHLKAQLNIRSSEEGREWDKTVNEENAFFYRLNWSSLLKQGVDSVALFQQRDFPIASRPPFSFAELSPHIGQVLLRLFFDHLKYCSKNPKTSFDVCELPDEDFSSILQVVDDPFLLQRPYSKFWDVEACPTERVLFVREGKLCRLPHNSQTASQWEMESSGHACWNKQDQLDLTCYNLYIDPGRRGGAGSTKDLLSEGRIFFDHFVGPLEFDPATGYLRSRVVAQYKKSSEEKGFFDQALKVEVSILELFKSVLRTGRELLWNGNFGSPSIVIDLNKAGLRFVK